MKKKTKTTTKKKLIWINIFTEEKRVCGGMGAATIVKILKSRGLNARIGYSPYVGHDSVEIEKGTLTKVKKVLKEFNHWFTKK